MAKSVRPPRIPGAPLEALGVAALRHDLSVHVVELEAQNAELNRLALELARQQADYFDLFDRAPVGYLVLGPHDIITEVNATAAALLGLSPEDLSGMPFEALIHESDQAEFRQHRSEPDTRRITPPLELRLRRTGSVPFWALMEWQTHRDEVRGESSARVTITDVSSRRNADAALRVSEARLQVVFTDAPIGVAIIDPVTGRFLEVNPRFAQITGRSMEELPTLDWMTITHPDDVAATLASMAQLNASAISGLRMEKRCRRPDGSIVWVMMTISPGHDGSQGRRFLCMVDDITETKRRDDLLAASEAELDAIIEAMPLGLAVLDAAGAVVRTNAALVRLLQLDDTQIKNGVHARRRFIRPDGTTMPREEWASRRAIAEQHVVTDVLTGVCMEGGGITWLSVSATPVAHSQGLTVVLSEDDTARQALLADLRASNLGLAEAQRLASVGSWTWNMASDETLWSDEMIRILGLANADSLARFGDLSSFTDREAMVRAGLALSLTMETGQLAAFEMTVRRSDGETRQIAAHAERLLDARGTPQGLRGSFADVTVLRKAQERVDDAERLLMIGRLAGGVAHDFNNMLMSMLAHVEFLRDAIPANDPRRLDVDAIHDAGERAAELTRQLLAFGRRQTLRPHLLDVDVVISGIRGMLHSLAGDLVRFVHEPTEPVGLVRVDRGVLEQVITNLVLNARDAMPHGGEIAIASTRVTIAVGDPRLLPAAAAGRYIRVTVTDTGSGMAAETLSHIFEPFFTTKPIGKGTGLGLSSVQGAVAQSGGFVTVDSTVGVGSRFGIYLPLGPDDDATDAATVPPPDHAGVHGGSKQILVVDDEPVVGGVTARTLRSLGYSVVLVTDPTTALAIVQASGTPFDALLADVMMPGITGPELADQLNAAGVRLPVLYMTGYAPEAAFSEGNVPPESILLAKPFSREELGSRLRQILGLGAAPG